MLSFEDEDGKNFSLRPDLTISACLDYIKNIKRGEHKYTYFDQAYRRTCGAESLVRNQLGCEIIGSNSEKSEIPAPIKAFSNSSSSMVPHPKLISIEDLE